MPNYLLEIGTEELPYKFIPSAIKQLQAALTEKLNENRITFSEIKVYGAPRRLAVIITDISKEQPDLTRVIKGPPAKIAFDVDNKLTQAGHGFAKKQGIDESCLYKETVDNVEYLFAKINEKGKPSSCLLQEIIPTMVLKLQGSHFMRWGDSEIKFSRPIRWIVSLLDTEEVKIQIGDVTSSHYSRGHRFATNTEVKIESPDTYLKDLFNAQVIVDPQARRTEIINQAVQIARTVKGKAVLDEDLIEEVSYITEWPVAVLGCFEEEYLAVPDDVIITVMASHQRYFPVFSDSDNKLMNYFITMSNSNQSNLENVKLGNQKVIKARLEDAMFFFKEDTKKSLESRINDLKGVTFQKGLGSLYDKTMRVKELSSFIAKNLNLSNESICDIEKTANLCKTDLITSLVREFTELQGVIGCEYAKLDKEKEVVATGIKEHYYPTVSDGELATSITGQIVGIADKIDTITAVFAIGKSPTGSADPLGLRRAAIGTLLTILKQDINLNLAELILKTIEILPVKVDDKEKLNNDIVNFIIQRLRIYFNEKYRYDIVEAVLNSKNPLFDIKDTAKRIEILHNLVSKTDYNRFHESAIRINKIMKSAKPNTSINNDLFVLDEEKELWNCLSQIDENSISYEELIKKLEHSIKYIENFFEKVLVMDKDEKVKQNRIALLESAKNKFLKLADFNKIVI